MAKAYHSLGFLMHQPPDVFSLLVEEHMGELLQIVNSYQNPLKYLNTYQDSIRIHVGFSGVLLEQLLNKEIIDACRKIIDIPLMLNKYGESKNVEIIGLGYSNPVFPMIPVADWDAQILAGREMVTEVFGQEPKGFWLSERGFCPEIIPVLKRNGYEYLILDRPFLKTCTQGQFSEGICSSPGNIMYQGIEIGAVTINQKGFVRKSGFLEEALAVPQYGGAGSGEPSLVFDWLFIDELNRSEGNDLPLNYEFWEEYFSPYLERIYRGKPGVKSVLLRERMHDWKGRDPIVIQKDNSEDHSSPGGNRTGDGLNRGSEEVWQFSRQYHELKSVLRKTSSGPRQEYLAGLLEQAQRWLLRSQTGRYFLADECAGIYDHIKPGLILLKEVKRQL